jgi:hypothetical protein
MERDHVYHDPSSGWIFEGGLRAAPTRELDHAITIEQMEG